MRKIFDGFLNAFKNYYFLFFCAFGLLLPEVSLRALIFPGVFSESYVSFASAAFTLSWILLIIFFCAFILPKTAGKIVFATVNIFMIIFSVSEYIYYKIFDQFFWLESIMLAGEGADYLDYAFQMVSTDLVIYTLLSILFLVLALAFWKSPSWNKKRMYILLMPVLALLVTHICLQPELHGDSMDQWDTWRKPRVVYKHYNDINKSFEISGLYQFTYMNFYKAIFPEKPYDEEDFAKVDAFFEAKEPTENRYTGLFEGKNVIIVMMESMDTWMIDKKHTPTLYKMMQNGIQFTNYNAPFFGTGFTFGSEFAFNTGFFTPVSAISATNFSSNTFPYSLARLFKEKGYEANSFHFNDSEFYNRGIMHKSFGYDSYHSLSEFGITGTEAELDSNMFKDDALYEKLTEKTPFMGFFITYSAHLPYTGEDAKLALAKEYYPQLINPRENTEKNNIHILAKDTDRFFEQLLARLEADGLLEDTVIIGYTDHFAYGVSDEDLLNEWKGDTLSYNVPAFIYAKGIKPMKIAKPMMTIDWAPTIVNLFALSDEARYIGSDILDPDNRGFAYFETWGWMDGMRYYIPSENNVAEEDVWKQNQRVKDSIETNDIVILGDYYKYR